MVLKELSGNLGAAILGEYSTILGLTDDHRLIISDPNSVGTLTSDSRWESWKESLYTNLNYITMAESLTHSQNSTGISSDIDSSESFFIYNKIIDVVNIGNKLLVDTHLRSEDEYQNKYQHTLIIYDYHNNTHQFIFNRKYVYHYDKLNITYLILTDDQFMITHQYYHLNLKTEECDIFILNAQLLSMTHNADVLIILAKEITGFINDSPIKITTLDTTPWNNAVIEVTMSSKYLFLMFDHNRILIRDNVRTERECKRITLESLSLLFQKNKISISILQFLSIEIIGDRYFCIRCQTKMDGKALLIFNLRTLGFRKAVLGNWTTLDMYLCHNKIIIRYITRGYHYEIIDMNTLVSTQLEPSHMFRKFITAPPSADDRNKHQKILNIILPDIPLVLHTMITSYLI